MRIWKTIATVAVLALLTSCTKEQVAKDYDVRFILRGGTMTKAAGTASGEDGVASLDILVYRSSDGNLVSSGHATGKTLTMTLPAGDYTCYAVANAMGSLAGAGTVSELEATVSRLSDMQVSKMEMVGKQDMTVGGSNVSVTIDVNRTMSKVILKDIHIAFSSAAYSSSVFAIKSIYLINVCPSVTYFGASAAPAASAWYNQSKYVSSAVDGLVYESYAKTMADGESDGVKHYFYAAPNSVTDDVQGAVPFTARHTRLVIEATMDGQPCYYPITLPVMERNHCYEIGGLTITGPGSDNPDILQSRVPVSFSISVNAWGTESQDVTL